MAQRYQEPGWFTRNVMSRAVAVLTRAGVSVAGSRVLEVQGRKSGEWRRTPVNVLNLGGAATWCHLVGITVTELAYDEKMPLLRAYLRRWKWEVGAFFGGVWPDSPDEELRRIAPDRPVFRIA
jgi:hypothetical protein